MDSLGLGLKTWLGNKSDDFARIMINALTVECPSGGNPECCQLFEIRKLSHREKNIWIESLSDEEIRDLYTVHFDCLVK